MTTLRVVIDQIVAPVPGGIGRYAEELTRALIATAPRGAKVAGIVSASSEPDYVRIANLLPGLSDLYKSPLARRELSAAWQHGFIRVPAGGIVHATSLLAPLRHHDRKDSGNNQVAVTIHDAVPWTHPETLTPRGVHWHKAMAKRAERYADAIVTDTHAVADQLSELLDLGDRVRVIGAAVGSSLRLPDDSDERAAKLGLPERFVLSAGTLEPRKGIGPLIRAMALGVPQDVPLLIVGPAGWGRFDMDAVAHDAGLVEGRARALGRLSDPDLAVALDRAAVFAFPSLAEGFGLPLIEAFSLGTPVVHSDDPALMENSAGAGLSVERSDADGYPKRLAEAIRAVLDDSGLARRMSIAGLDRARAFSWRDSAEKVWQLHAEL